LLKEGMGGMLGSLHWGRQYRWASDADATTVAAFEKVTEKEGGRESELTALFNIPGAEENKVLRNTVPALLSLLPCAPYAVHYKDFAQPAVLKYFRGHQFFPSGSIRSGDPAQ